MKLGIIADIHSNLPALTAVLDDMPRLDMLVCCGDLVGYYNQPEEVCTKIRELGIPLIRGNHDAYAVGDLLPQNANELLLESINWSANHLSEKNSAWLKSLPTKVAIAPNGKKIAVHHASPWDEFTYLYQDSQQLERIKLNSDEILIIGHTHYPMIKDAADGIIINPGSVGQPRDWNPLASYALLDTETMQAQIKRVCYNVEKLQKKLRVQSWNQQLIDILNRNRRSEHDK